MPKDTRFDDYQDTPFGIDQKVFLATQWFPSQNWFPGSVQQPSQYIPSSAWENHPSAANHQFRISSQSNCRLCLHATQSLDCQGIAGPVRSLSGSADDSRNKVEPTQRENQTNVTCVHARYTRQWGIWKALFGQRGIPPWLLTSRLEVSGRQELRGTGISACLSIADLWQCGFHHKRAIYEEVKEHSTLYEQTRSLCDRTDRCLSLMSLWVDFSLSGKLAN